jgi:hypothetical protein
MISERIFRRTDYLTAYRLCHSLHYVVILLSVYLILRTHFASPDQLELYSRLLTKGKSRRTFPALLLLFLILPTKLMRNPLHQVP